MQAENLPVYQANVALNNEKKKREAELRLSEPAKTPKKEGLLGLDQNANNNAKETPHTSYLSDTARQLDEATREKSEPKALTADQMIKESQDLNKEVQKKTGDASGKDGNAEDSWIRQGISWYENKVGDTSEYDNLEQERKKLLDDSQKFAADGVITKEEQQAYDSDKKRLEEKYEIYSKDREKTVNGVAIIASTTTQIAGTFIPGGGVFIGAVAGAVVDTAIRNGEENKGLGLGDVTTIATKTAINYAGGKLSAGLAETQIAKQLITKGTEASVSAGTKVFEATGSKILAKATEFGVREGTSVIVKSTADTVGGSVGKVASNKIDAVKNGKEYGVTDALRDIKDVAIGSVVANVTLKGAIPATKYLDKHVDKLSSYTTTVAGDKAGKVVDWVGKNTSNILVHGVRNTSMLYAKTGEINLAQGYTNAVCYKVGDTASLKKGITNRTEKEQASLSITGYGKIFGTPPTTNDPNYDKTKLEKTTPSTSLVDNIQPGAMQDFNFA